MRVEARVSTRSRSLRRWASSGLHLGEDLRVLGEHPLRQGPVPRGQGREGPLQAGEGPPHDPGELRLPLGAEGDPLGPEPFRLAQGPLGQVRQVLQLARRLEEGEGGGVLGELGHVDQDLPAQPVHLLLQG